MELAGTRFCGRTVLGFMGFGTNDSICYVPAKQLENAITSFTLNPYYNAESQTGKVSVRGIAFPLHPLGVTRLDFESASWGRYVYRRIRVFSLATSSTASTNSYVFSVGHDVSLPLTSSWMNDVDSNQKTNVINLLGMESSVQGAAYQGFDIREADYKGDRTFPCAVPYYDTTLNDTDMAALATETESYEQFFYAVRNTSATSSSQPNAGTVFIEYEIDFYSPRYTPDPSLKQFDPTTGTMSASTSSGSLSSRGFLSARSNELRKALVTSHGDKDSKDKVLDSKGLDPIPLKRPVPRRTVGREEVAGRSRSSDRLVYHSSPAEMVDDCPCCGQLPCKKDRRDYLDS